MSTSAILAEDLHKQFGSVQALRGVSLEVPTGTVLGLLGPNGAGKTTAVRILATTIRPDSGRAMVNGHDVSKDPQAVRTSIGLAGQYAAVDENLTGHENITLVGRLNHLRVPAARIRATELLERFALSDAGDRPARTYSGGMRRRLDLAAALVTQPPVLFLDEPTTGLDPASRAMLWSVIEDLVADGTTVLLTTQYLEEADRLADRIVVIDGGAVVAEGTASELKSRLGDTIIELTYPHRAAVDAAMAALEGHHPTRDPAGAAIVRVVMQDGPTTLRSVLNRLDGALVPEAVAVHEPTLDDVFLTLTGAASTSSVIGPSTKQSKKSKNSGAQ